ncbi:MAG: adenylate/guanylate cyclase domain-containing protein [Bacteroidota bacterium]
MRRSIFILVTLLVCCFSAKAQISTILEADSSSVLYLLRVAGGQEDQDSVRLYLEEAFNQSRQLDFATGSILALQGLSLLEQQERNLSAALRYALQELSYLDPQLNPQLYFDALIRIGSIYQDENLDNKAKEYYQQALPFLSNGLKQAQEIDLLRRMGLTYSKINEPDSSLMYYQELVSVYQEQGDTLGIIQTYQNVANILSQQQEHEAAIRYNEEIKNLLHPSDPSALATILNNIGYNYSRLGKYDEAIDYFKQTEKICRETEYVNLADLYTNLGITFNNQGRFNQSINYLQKASGFLKKGGQQKQEKAYLENLIATVYLGNKDMYNALRYNEGAMFTAQQGQNARLLSECYKTAAEVHQGLYEYEKALDFYQKHLDLRDSFLLEERLRQQELLQQQISLERAEKEISLLLVNQEVQKYAIRQLELEKTKLELESDKLRLESKSREDKLTLLLTEQEVREANLRNKELETQKAQQDLALVAQRLEAEKKDRALIELRQNEKLKALEQANLERQNEVLKKDKDILTRDKKLLTQEQELNRSELARQEQFRQFFYGLVALLFLILILILSGLVYSRKANQKLAQQNNQIEKQKEELEKSKDEIERERHKSESLLLNILPAEMASELKEKGGATPRQYDSVTVMFTDFSGFTGVAESMSPQALIEELNICFRAFDEIIENHNIEKIKTIGDAYMCAGGIPVTNDTSPYDAIAAALEMQAYMNRRIALKESEGKVYWNMRIGIHTGQVIAGVIGIKRFAYDIWGDTVNVASRLENSSEPGKINISGDTYQLVKDRYPCVYRGDVAVKHKGEISMYFVDEVAARLAAV